MGRLFFDANGDDRYTKEDTPIAYQRLALVRAQSSVAYITYTQSDGSFVFPPVPASSYNLYLGAWSPYEEPLQIIRAYGETHIRVHVPLTLAERIYIPFVR